MIIAAANNLHIKPFLKITLQHPSSIAPRLRSSSYPPFSPIETLHSGVDGPIANDIFIVDSHILTHSTSIILARPFQRDGDGPARGDDDIDDTTSHQGRLDGLDRLDHQGFGFLDNILYLHLLRSTPPATCARIATRRRSHYRCSSRTQTCPQPHRHTLPPAQHSSLRTRTRLHLLSLHRVRVAGALCTGMESLDLLRTHRNDAAITFPSLAARTQLVSCFGLLSLFGRHSFLFLFAARLATPLSTECDWRVPLTHTGEYH